MATTDVSPFMRIISLNLVTDMNFIVTLLRMHSYVTNASGDLKFTVRTVNLEDTKIPEH